MPPKRNPDSDAVTKILALYTLLLFRRKEYSLRELSETLVCSKQTIMRLCARLETFAADFRTELREGERLYWLEKPEMSPKPALAAEALKCLAMCRNIATNVLPDEIVQESEEAIRRAQELLNDIGKQPENTRGDQPETVTVPEKTGVHEAAVHEARVDPIEVQEKGFIDYSNCHEKISRLMKSIEERRVCRVFYQKEEGSHSKEQYFLPLRIRVHNEVLYADGWSVSDRAPVELLHETTLAVHRIRIIALTLRAVSRSQDIEWKTERDTFAMTTADQCRAIVEFTPKAAYVVRERRVSRDQVVQELPSGGLVLEFSGSRREALAWILSFGPEATVKAPDDLRESVISKLGDMRKRYEA